MAVHPQLTWAQIKSWAEANQVPGDALVVLTLARGEHNIKCVDLDHTEAGEGDPAVFFLQGYWG